jgi:hypothetical protein
MQDTSGGGDPSPCTLCWHQADSPERALAHSPAKPTNFLRYPPWERKPYHSGRGLDGVRLIVLVVQQTFGRTPEFRPLISTF